jgi:hypothetical protein
VSLEAQGVAGHTTGDITSHYSATELHELIEAVNRVWAGDRSKTPALTLIKTKAAK